MLPFYYSSFPLLCNVINYPRNKSRIILRGGVLIMMTYTLTLP
nr:MAG TPA: hypothetical protein [Herelleviridae sp.]